MSAVIVNGLVREQREAAVMMTGPVLIPEMRIEEDLIEGVRLLVGAVGKPTMIIPCASRTVAGAAR